MVSGARSWVLGLRTVWVLAYFVSCVLRHESRADYRLARHLQSFTTSPLTLTLSYAT